MVYRIGTQDNDRKVGIAPLRISLYRNRQKSFFRQDQARINAFDLAPVAGKHARCSEIVAQVKNAVRWMEITSLTDRPLTSRELLIGRWFEYSINRGQIVTSGVSSQILVIRSGQEVSVQREFSFLQLAMAADAMQPEGAGATTRARNNQLHEGITYNMLNGKSVRVPAH